VIVNNAFVPDYRVLRFSDAVGSTAPGAESNKNPLYRISDGPAPVPRSSNVLALVGFVADFAPPGLVADGPFPVLRSSNVLVPVGFVADVALPGFIPDDPVPVLRSSNVLAPVGFVADLAPPAFVPGGPVSAPRSSRVLAPGGFVPIDPGFFAPAPGSAVVDVSFAATTPLPANSPGFAVAAIAGLPWFSDARRALFSLAVRSCWSCEGTAATCGSCVAACSSCVGRTVVPPDPPLKLTRDAPGST